MCQQINFESLKNNITDKLLTYDMYKHSTVWKQMSCGLLKSVIYNLRVYKSYV